VGIDARGCGVGRSAARAKGAAIILKKYIASLLSRIFVDLHSSARKWTPIGYAWANSLRAKKSGFLMYSTEPNRSGENDCNNSFARRHAT
jgi:hypothetical protein